MRLIDRCKIQTLSELLYSIEEHRRQNHTIVMTNGCFDLLHIGHISSLKAASKLGDVLVVALNSDYSIKRLKGDNRPIFNQQDRSEILAALGYVDYIVVFDEPTPSSVIYCVRPDVLVKGKDWEGKSVTGKDLIESYGGKVVFLDMVCGISTTDIINRICKEFKVE